MLLFNAFEINKVREYPDPNGGTICEPELSAEPIEHDEECIGEFYTVSGRKSDGCVEALVDRIEEKDAKKICDFFCQLLKVFVDGGHDF